MSGFNSRMHLKCPSGHSRLKHGLQTMSILAMRATGDSGGVYTGDEGNADGGGGVHQA
jgi:hypothetical protein